MSPAVRFLGTGSLMAFALPGVTLSGEFEDQAITAAEERLVLVDRGEYEACRKAAATFFRSAVTAEQWYRDRDYLDREWR